MDQYQGIFSEVGGGEGMTGQYNAENMMLKKDLAEDEMRRTLIRKDMVKTKICTKCKKEFPVIFEYLYRNAKSPDGYSYVCRTCANKRRKESNQKKKM